MQHLKVKFNISAVVSTTLHMGHQKSVEKRCQLINFHYCKHSYYTNSITYTKMFLYATSQ